MNQSKSRYKLIRKYLLCGALLAFFTASAFGATISYSVVASEFLNGGNRFESNDLGTFTLSKFDSSLGTLNSVTLTLTAVTYGGTIAMDNTQGASGKGRVALGSAVTVAGAGSLIVLSAPFQENRPYSLGRVGYQTYSANVGGSDFFNPAHADVLRINGGATTQTEQTVSSDLGDLALYSGAGQITYDFSSSMISDIQVSTTYSSLSVAPKFDFTANVTYDYEPNPNPPPPQVPEPGTLGLAAVLGSLALTRWRRSRRANR